MAAEPDPQRLLTALTTEHFTLQGARSQTVGESASRASLHLFSVSSTLVALGFIGQISTVGDTFKVFAPTVLPTLYALGLFTFVRLVQSVTARGRWRSSSTVARSFSSTASCSGRATRPAPPARRWRTASTASFRTSVRAT